MTMATGTWIKHPGFYIEEELEARGWLQRDLAFIIGCPEQAINMIVSGKRGITPEMAKALGDAFDISPETFANLQKSYELAHATNPYQGVAERRVMQDRLPVRAMIQRGWIQNSDVAMLEEQLRRFFGGKSLDEISQLRFAAKKPNRDIQPAQLAWLYRVQNLAKEMPATKYSEKKLHSALTEFAGMTIEPEQVRHIPRVLSECGVRYVVVEKLPNASIDGVCFWLDKDSPVIGMSLQHDQIDNFWFVLRHEVEHVLDRHGQKEMIVDVDLDKSESTGTEEEERLANDAAANFCIPQDKLDSFIQRKQPFFYQKDVISFARVQHRHPGIAVGQLRRRLGRYDYLTKYLYSFKIRALVLPGAVADGWGQVIPTSL